MLYVGTRNWRYLALGIAAGVVASVAAYFLFSHVRVRVQVWKDPFASYTGDGYQVAQSLFAIGAGGWFGTGALSGVSDHDPHCGAGFYVFCHLRGAGRFLCNLPDPYLYELFYHVCKYCI
ncbi:MAG: FtsW/RodA/SpoVE family cell cycle protein [Blautia sp.]